MRKIVIISTCSECPHLSFVATQDQGRPRVPVGCGWSKKSFDYEFMNVEPIPIPDWCEMPNEEGDLPVRKKDPHQEDYQ